MNCFSNLDFVFPVGAQRLSGEVVSVSCDIYACFEDETGSYEPDLKLGNISWKRKAWYVNASVNAWHLHRNLCRELRELMLYRGYRLTRRQASLLYRSLRTMVQFAYLRTADTGDQYWDFRLSLTSGDWYLQSEHTLSF